MTTRTACSASLVAFHEACVAISRHDCDSAVVGGVNLIMTPGATMSMTEQNVLSRDGSCKTFSADADGYARGEAVTAIYIKRLDHALRDGNPIRAVIRGTATNHDGKTPGFSVPSTKTQETLIRRAYQVAGITDFSKTGYVECHGTGTPVGDPIETSAVGQVFGESGVYIGSIKPNFGHTEGASGLLSVIKTVLALEYGIIPPNIKFSRPNPAIPFDSAKLTVAVTPTPWPEGRLQRASVNAFGIGGTNAHAVIDSASSVQAPAASKQSSDEASLLLFSANSKKSLAKMVENYRDFAEKKPECIRDLAYTLANKRQHLPYRTFAIASNGSVRAVPSATRSTKPSAIIMVFTGQGAQWPQMGRELLDTNEAFRSSIRRLDEYLQSVPLYASNWGIEAELRKSSKKSRVHQAEFAQPLSTAVQIALVDALETLNIRPAAVVGHSSGEIAAAYAAGALTAEQAIMNAVLRGAVTNLQKRSGTMAAVALSWDEVEKHLVGNVAIACDNSPKSVTISGDVDEVKTVIERIHRLQPDVSARKLQIDRAYHSYHMAEIGEQYYALLEGIVKARKPKKLFFSSVTGCLLDDNAILDSHYWQRNLERPVMFRGAVSSILQHPVGKNPVFLEIGPHSALGGPLRQILAQESSRAPYTSALSRNQNCVESLLSAIGMLWTLQIPISLDELVPTGLCLSDLPPYPWDHEESYWYETRLSKDYRLRKYPHHDLLGVKVVESTDFEPSWRNLFHLNTAPWVRDHRVGEDIVFPFAAYVAMAGEAIRQIAGIDQTFRLRHIIVSTALVIAEGKPTEMITTLRPHRLTDTLNSKWWEFIIASHNGHTWTKHCTGEVMAQAEPLGLSSNPETLPRRVDASKWFDVLQRAGLDLGPEFRKIGVMSAGTIRQQATGEMLNERQDKTSKYHIHPTVIDGALQLVGVAFANGEARKVKNRLPISCDDFSISRSSLNFTVDAAAQLTADSVVGEARGITAGNIVLSISGLKLRATDQSYSTETSSIQQAAARQEWGPDIDFLDLKGLVKPLGDLSLYTHLLDKLSHLCIVYIRKWLAGSNTEGPHLRNFRRWVEMQFDSLNLSRFGDIDDDTFLERIHDLVHGLADTPATAAAIALQQICSNLDAVFSDPTASWRDILTAEIIAELHEITTKCDTSSFIQKLAHCKPNLRILEIGSSRSSPSSSLLQALTLRSGRPCYSKYTFTSKGFVSTHQDSTQFPNLQYATLDINDDPLEQGFELCSYDLIIASNVVHTTRNISASLRNIKRLLHPTGYLLLQELCPDTKWINIILGADPRWWCGLEDSRLDEPYISLRQWQKELVAAEFEDANAVVPDSAEPFQLSAVIIAKASNEHDLIRNVTLLCRSITMASSPILQELENRGYKVTRCTLHDVPPPGQDVIALLDEDSPFFEDIDAATFEAFKSFLLNLGDSGLFWVTRLSQICCQDPRFAQAIGTARTIRSELLIDFATCEVDDINTSTTQLIRVFAKFQRRSTDESLKPDFEYCIYDGIVNVGRFYPFTLSEDLLISRSSDRAMLDVSVPGRPTTLHWVRKPPHPPLQPDEVEVEIYSVGLNFRVSKTSCIYRKMVKTY
jgi:acyl transferase domain-containing protein/SAM-dependent methyltransferase